MNYKDSFYMKINQLIYITKSDPGFLTKNLSDSYYIWSDSWLKQWMKLNWNVHS